MRGRFRSGFDEVFRPGPERRLFYGWRIVAVGMVLQLVNSGLFLQAYGAYVVLLQADLGWSRTMLSAGFSMARSESAVLGPIQGHLLDRYGPRAIMRTGVVMFGVGFLLLSRVQEPWQFFLALVVMAVGSSFAGWVSVTVAVVNWFQKRRSTAVGFSSAGFALGGMVVPLVVVALNAFGWRATAFGTGLLLLLGGPLLVQVVRHRPADLGLHVDGLPPADAVAPGDEDPVEPGGDRHVRPGAHAGPARVPLPAFTGRQAMRTWAFWQISLGHALAVFFISALMVHLIPHLTGELGYSLELAGLVVGLITIVQFVATAAGGVVGDRFDKRRIAVTTMLLHGAAALLLTIAVSPLLVVVFAVLQGIAWGVRGPLLSAWRADLFGAASYGSIIGYSSLIVMLGSASGPIMAGVMYDVFGNYTTALRVLAACTVVGAVLFALVRDPPPPPVVGAAAPSAPAPA